MPIGSAFRPHKGGYIDAKSIAYFSDLVPPSQGRVYRVLKKCSWSSSCSALTRAGISFFLHLSNRRFMFRPHKGGYIDMRTACREMIVVPPSQGRVYRRQGLRTGARHRSALTRAGISSNYRKRPDKSEFRPHKGGYIRTRKSQCLCGFRSALTRAGISESLLDIIKKLMFRHPKGGYIDQLGRMGRPYQVPPSQGRVYHSVRGCQNARGSSALTRAGIRVLNIF